MIIPQILTITKGYKMFRYREYSIEEVFEAMENKIDLPGARSKNLKSQRLELFKVKGVVCVTCGLEANVFILETHDENVAPHLNLYYRDNEDYILFTKDHIYPKSLGGKNELSNYQTMCTKCNSKKSDKLV